MSSGIRLSGPEASHAEPLLSNRSHGNGGNCNWGEGVNLCGLRSRQSYYTPMMVGLWTLVTLNA